MTTPRRDLISAAVEAFIDGEANCAGVLDGRLTASAHDSRCCARAGLAAALPHLGDACDALRAAERSEVSTPTPEPITAVSGNLSGLQGHSAPTPNPTDATQED